MTFYARLIGFSLLLSSANIFSQDSNYADFSMPERSAEIVFDGVVDLDEWQGIEAIPLVSHWPVYAEEANLNSKIYLGYTEDYIYVSAICNHDPALIQETTFERDVLSMAMDHIVIGIDAYNDNENTLLFGVTPTGSRIDISFRNDAIGQAPNDDSWNSFWEAKVSKFDEGWMAEIRIPFSSLRFQSVDNKVNMGLIVYRYAAKNRELDVFPKMEPNWGFWSFIKASQAQNVVINKSQNKRPWFTSPYILGNTGYHHNHEGNSEVPEKINDNKITAGLDVQHALTDNLNLDLSLNTDFAQVEADDQVVNLSRFSLFFPEKRRFFLERSSIMDFRFENNNRLFYSRRIGINDGRIVPLWGGARVVGRVGDFDVGSMSMQSRSFESNVSENFSILRLRKKVSKSNSYIGGIITNRTDFNGATQSAYGVDGIINIKGNDYLQVNMVNSTNTADKGTYANFLEGRKRLYLRWENRSQVGFNYVLSYSQADAFYEGGMGFEERTNFKAIGDQVGYGWFLSEHKNIRYLRLDLKSKAFLTASTNKLESYLISPVITFDGVRANALTLTYEHFYDRVPSDFQLSDDFIIPAATYVNKNLLVTYSTPRVNLLTAQFTATTGKFYDGNRISVGLTPTYVLSKYLTLSGFYQYNQIGFDDGLYQAHVGRIKISTSFNVKLSINAFVQANSLSKTNAINVRLRYNSKDGDDLYIVYNEVLNGNGIDDALLPYSDYRGLTLKYIRTFRL